MFFNITMSQHRLPLQYSLNIMVNTRFFCSCNFYPCTLVTTNIDFARRFVSPPTPTTQKSVTTICSELQQWV